MPNLALEKEIDKIHETFTKIAHDHYQSVYN